MFELPEFMTLAKQMNETLTGKIIQRGQLVGHLSRTWPFLEFGKKYSLWYATGESACITPSNSYEPPILQTHAALCRAMIKF